MSEIEHAHYGIDLRCAMCDGEGNGCRYCDGEGICTVYLDEKYVPTSKLQGAVDALQRIRDHGQTHDQPCWALHKGDCADAMQEIARAALPAE